MQLLQVLIFALSVTVSLALNSMNTDNSANINLFNALKSNEREYIQELIDLCDNINARIGQKSTVLIEAAAYGNTPAVQALIKAKADLNAQDDHGDTALIFAARWNLASIVSILIEAGADVNIKNKLGITALMLAAHYTTLMPAHYYASIPIVHMLIGAGAQLTLQDNQGATALNRTPKHDLRLIELFDDAEKRTASVFKLLATPAPDRKIKMTEPLLYNQQVLKLQTAMRELESRASKHLVVNLLDPQGNRPLHAALIAQNKYMVQLVLKLMLQAKRGESVMQTNTNGHTPVHLAVGQSPDLWLRLLGKFIYPAPQTNLNKQ